MVRDLALTSSAAIPYPALEHHALVGDRRTAALIASDGTVDWLCLPDYDGPVVFGSLLDAAKGGHWKLGPTAKISGEQTYYPRSMVLKTRWRLNEGVVSLTDAMPWPEAARPPELARARVLVRHLICERGCVRCSLEFQPGCNFTRSPNAIRGRGGRFEVRLPNTRLHLWTTLELQKGEGTVFQEFQLREGEEIWAVLEQGQGTIRSATTARKLLRGTLEYWRRWLAGLHYRGASAAKIQRSALVLHQLTYSPAGSIVAAPTASIPERIGGGWNADYRFCWVRDASLSLASLQRLGDWKETEKYLEWLSGRPPSKRAPLQVLYGIHGETAPKQHELRAAAGYRGSKPVRLGNHAYKQFQIDEFGFLADCVWSYLRSGGQWSDDYWRLVRRCADYVCRNWHRRGNGIWELPCCQHYVSGRIMSWVMLDRAIRIGAEVAPQFSISHWAETRTLIHREVMERGWSKKLGAFRQRYETENLDAAALLIPVFEFLPADHPRVLSTICRIEQDLTIDGWVYRFKPSEVKGLQGEPFGEMEGAFLPCTLWLATAYAKAGERARAQRILRRVERLAGKPGLLAEAVDPRTGCFLGNTPLLFSHVEYVRACLELDASGP